jgi:hypothetical protein
MANTTSHTSYGHIDPSAPIALRALMAVYRFFASLKLAVISIGSLAAALGYATFYEKKHGSPATQEHVYQSVPFALLLLFLAINIFCAASIRFPWKARQTGFVITHIGLLILIFGSWWGFKYSDEGQAGSPEGGSIDKLIRFQAPVIRIREVDRKTGAAEGEYELPFQGGTFDWPAGQFQVISQAKDPFKVAVKAFYTAGVGKHVHVAGPDGSPMLRIRPRMKPPGGKAMMDVFQEDEERWLAIPARTMGYRTSRKAGPAKFAFLYVDKPELIDDFLNPPKNPGVLGIARLRYADKTGKIRTYEMRIDDAKPDVPIVLPDSDLTVSFIEANQRETENPNFVTLLGDSELSVVRLNVSKANGPKIVHTGFAAQPMIPAVIASEEGQKAEEPLLSIGYFRPPTLGGAGMAGNFGVVEVMGDPEGKLYYRVFGRDETPTPADQPKVPKPGIIKGTPGPLKLDEEITAFGGNPNMPMTLAFSAEQYLTSGVEKTVYEKLELPIGQRGNGLAAALIEMTVNGETKEFWVHRPPGLNPVFDPISFKSKDYQIAYDCDRKPLGFTLKLDDFDIGFEPGTEQPTRFVSHVRLTDEEKGIKDKPITISMNNPLTHRNLTFYQSSYERLRDPTTRRETGDFQSVFQVGYDAGRVLKYFGCILVVIGAFLQFTWRLIIRWLAKIGINLDSSVRDDAIAADRARRLLERKVKPQLVAASAQSKAKAKARGKLPKSRSSKPQDHEIL